MTPHHEIANARRLTIMLHSRDHVHHHSLATELLSRARLAHLAGATMLLADQGQGRSGALHRQHLFDEDVPLSIVIVDGEAKITAFIDEIRELVSEAFIVVEPVTAFRA